MATRYVKLRTWYDEMIDLLFCHSHFTVMCHEPNESTHSLIPVDLLYGERSSTACHARKG